MGQGDGGLEKSWREGGGVFGVFMCKVDGESGGNGGRRVERFVSGTTGLVTGFKGAESGVEFLVFVGEVGLGHFDLNFLKVRKMFFVKLHLLSLRLRLGSHFSRPFRLQII